MARRSSLDTTRSAPEGGPAYPIGSVANALDVLLLVGGGSALRVTELADRLGIARSSAFRLLATLQHAGYVVQDPDSKAYEAGRSLTDLGLAAVDRLEFRRVVRGHLEALRTLTGETCAAGILDGTELLIVESVPGWMPLRVVDRPGDRFPAHQSSAGKAILAQVSSDELRSLYPNEELLVTTEQSIGTRSELEAELAEVRRRGWASTSEEYEDDVRAVAACVVDRAGVVRGAIGVAFPASRAWRGSERFGPQVVEVARALGELLGP